MQEQILRKLFLSFIPIHILSHAKKDPFYGAWMIEELNHHGYNMSAGTLYPILHSLEKSQLLTVTNQNVEGKIRKYYHLTKEGQAVLEEASTQAQELLKEFN